MMTQKIRVLIVDDEPFGREGVRVRLQTDTDIDIIGECQNGLEAVAGIQKLKPDLVFLDIQMPKLNGFGVIETIGIDQMPAVVFVTAYDKYALQAFKVNAIDYLLKPFDSERFFTALNRAKKQLQQQDITTLNQQLRNLIAALGSGKNYLERVVVKSSGRIFFLNAAEIDWLEAAENYVSLHVGNETHLIRDTMNAMAAKLNPMNFLRLRQSAIVNLRHIKELRPMGNGEYLIILQDGARLTSSRRYRKNLAALLGE